MTKEQPRPPWFTGNYGAWYALTIGAENFVLWVSHDGCDTWYCVTSGYLL
jgi:hypothetical protein